MAVQFGANVGAKSNRRVGAFYAGLEHTFSKIGAIGANGQNVCPKIGANGKGRPFTRF